MEGITLKATLDDYHRAITDGTFEEKIKHEPSNAHLLILANNLFSKCGDIIKHWDVSDLNEKHRKDMYVVSVELADKAITAEIKRRKREKLFSNKMWKAITTKLSNVSFQMPTYKQIGIGIGIFASVSFINSTFNTKTYTLSNGISISHDGESCNLHEGGTIKSTWNPFDKETYVYKTDSHVSYLGNDCKSGIHFNLPQNYYISEN